MTTEGTDRVAVVTGASGDIGRSICATLAGAEYRVAGLDSRAAPEDAQWDHAPADVGRPDEVVRAFDGVESRMGPVDVLVNNAGTYLAVEFLETTFAQFEQVMSSNVASAFWCSQEFARRAIKRSRSGVIVNVASISGRMGSADCAYGASKGAIIAMTRGLGAALAPHGIRVNAVAPGVVDSTMADRIPADRRAHYLAQVPLGRFAKPVEIAAVVTFLAGESSSYLTRAVVDVNGGLL